MTYLTVLHNFFQTSSDRLKKETVGAEVEAMATKDISTKPMTPQELREMLTQSKNAPDDDCLMCGS